MGKTPRYLEDYEEIWEDDPKQANLAWFRDANWGLFIHYGLYSQRKCGEWTMFRDKIPIADYAKLADSFDPRNFDADFITDLALEAQMKYVNLVTCHHDGFCLWKSDVEAFNSYAYVKRDLVRETAKQCDRKGLGFFTYYTYVLNWRHPYSIPSSIYRCGRPAYDFEEPVYVNESDYDISKYWEYAHAEMTELLELEYPLAGMWLDIIMAYYAMPDLIRVEDSYDLIRRLRPETLISFKQGATGTEDFASPEFDFESLARRVLHNGLPEEAARRADTSWEKLRHKHNEICMSLHGHMWGYREGAHHCTVDEIRARLGRALVNNCNLLANVGPLPDGSIHPDDIRALRMTGKSIVERGWPGEDEAMAVGEELKGQTHAGAQ